MKKRYYVEFCIDELADYIGDTDYFAQSGWKDSVEECLEWATKVFHFFFVNFDYENFTKFITMCLMSSEFDEDDEYGDINQEYRLFYDHHYARVVKEQDVYKAKLPFQEGK